jgi:hypothetical protein
MTTAQPQAKKTNWALYIGSGCLGLVVVCCVLPGGGYFGGNAVLKSKVESQIDTFIEAGHRRDGAAMYGTLAPEFRARSSPEMLSSGVSSCAGLSTYTSYDVHVEADHPFDDFLITQVTFHTPTGDIDGSFGIENEREGPQVWNYSEYGGGQAYGTCNLRTGY